MIWTKGRKKGTTNTKSKAFASQTQNSQSIKNMNKSKKPFSLSTNLSLSHSPSLSLFVGRALFYPIPICQRMAFSLDCQHRCSQTIHDSDFTFRPILPKTTCQIIHTDIKANQSKSCKEHDRKDVHIHGNTH